MSIATNVHFFELLFTNSSSLTLIIVIESFGINKNLDDGVSDPAPDEVL